MVTAAVRNLPIFCFVDGADHVAISCSSSPSGQRQQELLLQIAMAARSGDRGRCGRIKSAAWAQFQQYGLHQSESASRPERERHGRSSWRDNRRVRVPFSIDFNNGGYLDLPPLSSWAAKARYLVDGRPEAYPASVFRRHGAQDESGAGYRLGASWMTSTTSNAIVFCLDAERHSGQLKDSSLARGADQFDQNLFVAVYNFNLILSVGTGENAAAIKAYEIPRSQFR